MTLTLAVDTASARFAVAATRGDEVLFIAVHDVPQAHSRSLLEAINRAIETAGSRPDRLVAVVGPGSYAGLRVGLATVQGLALGAGLPVGGVGTLPAVAAASGKRRVVAIHPVGRGEFAAQSFLDGEAQGPVRLLAAATLPTYIAGEGAGDLGGLEVTPRERCLAAARLVPAMPQSTSPDLDAVYVREPSISRPRRLAAGADRTPKG